VDVSSILNPKKTPVVEDLIGNTYVYTAERGWKLYELTNHLGNVLVTVTDKKIGVPSSGNSSLIDHYTADVVSASDYYPFGMLMPGRKFESGEYRYGFNGQEKSNEIKGEGQSYTAEYWEYDPRLGRRWNIDPKPNPSISVYAAFEGNPILFTDILGDSIAPNRTRAVNVFVVPIKKDMATEMDYKRLLETQKESSTTTIIMHADHLDKDVANRIIQKHLGTDGYINTLVIDYHRSEYDNMDKAKQDEFYATLSKGYAGDKTNVLLGMCWSGGGPTYKNRKLPDLTLNISQKLDKATVYGLRTEAMSWSFRATGDFGSLNPAYIFSNDVYAKNDRANVSVWTMSKYSPTLKKFTSERVHKTVTLSLKGEITVSEKTYEMGGGIPKYEHGRIM
jgi:RHS repeat-associated protein